METSFNDASNDRSARLMKRKGGDLYSQQWKVQKKSRSFLVGSLSPFNYYPQPKTNFELVNQALDQYCGTGVKNKGPRSVRSEISCVSAERDYHQHKMMHAYSMPPMMQMGPQGAISQNGMVYSPIPSPMHTPCHTPISMQQNFH